MTHSGHRTTTDNCSNVFAKLPASTAAANPQSDADAAGGIADAGAAAQQNQQKCYNQISAVLVGGRDQWQNEMRPLEQSCCGFGAGKSFGFSA
jgi:hypothetical protein